MASGSFRHLVQGGLSLLALTMVSLPARADFNDAAPRVSFSGVVQGINNQTVAVETATGTVLVPAPDGRFLANGMQTSPFVLPVGTSVLVSVPASMTPELTLLDLGSLPPGSNGFPSTFDGFLADSAAPPMFSPLPAVAQSPGGEVAVVTPAHSVPIPAVGPAAVTFQGGTPHQAVALPPVPPGVSTLTVEPPPPPSYPGYGSGYNSFSPPPYAQNYTEPAVTYYPDAQPAGYPAQPQSEDNNFAYPPPSGAFSAPPGYDDAGYGNGYGPVGYGAAYSPAPMYYPPPSYYPPPAYYPGYGALPYTTYQPAYGYGVGFAPPVVAPPYPYGFPAYAYPVSPYPAYAAPPYSGAGLSLNLGGLSLSAATYQPAPYMPYGYGAYPYSPYSSTSVGLNLGGVSLGYSAFTPPPMVYPVGGFMAPASVTSVSFGGLAFSIASAPPPVVMAPFGVVPMYPPPMAAFAYPPLGPAIGFQPAAILVQTPNGIMAVPSASLPPPVLNQMVFIQPRNGALAQVPLGTALTLQQQGATILSNPIIPSTALLGRVAVMRPGGQVVAVPMAAALHSHDCVILGAAGNGSLHTMTPGAFPHEHAFGFLPAAAVHRAGLVDVAAVGGAAAVGVGVAAHTAFVHNPGFHPGAFHPVQHAQAFHAAPHAQAFHAAPHAQAFHAAPHAQAFHATPHAQAFHPIQHPQAFHPASHPETFHPVPHSQAFHAVQHPQTFQPHPVAHAVQTHSTHLAPVHSFTAGHAAPSHVKAFTSAPNVGHFHSTAPSAPVHFNPQPAHASAPPSHSAPAGNGGSHTAPHDDHHH